MKRYERRLPHWDVIGQPLFVTFRLHNSLPANRVFPPADLSSGRAFVALDRILDRAAAGPLYLKIPEIAKVVVAAVYDGEQKLHKYVLHAFVVMPNHVHMLITPNVEATRWLGPLKGFTAYQANRILGSVGKPFWQHEGYDHLVRNGEEFGRIRRYIENNPVTAGIVENPEQFPWSSARKAERAQAV